MLINKSLPHAKKDIITCFIIFSIFTIPVAFYEYQVIDTELRALFVILKSSVISATLLIFYFLFKRPNYQPLVFTLGISLCAYGTIGEYFSPLYFLSFVQCILGYMILLRPSRKTFITITAFGWIPIMYIQYLKEIGEITHSRDPVIADYVTIMVVFTSMFIVIFEGYSKRRRKEIEYREKFSLIGENSNILAHNIKSLVGTQFLILDNLKEKNKKDVEEIDDLEKNLEFVQKYLHQLNTLARDEESEFNVLSSIMNIIDMIKIPHENLEINNKPLLINSNKQDIETILLNIFSNAKKSINSSDLINIKVDHLGIQIKVPKSENYTHGSGIGIEIIRKLSLKNKIVFDFKKDKDKVKYLLIFPATKYS